MYRLAHYRSDQRVIDPSCGDGAFLRPVAGNQDVFGCEADERYRSLLGKLLPRDQVVIGDALASLVPLWGTFDIAIGNPPFSAQASLERRTGVLQGYDLGTGRAAQCLEVLFLELFLKLVKVRGRIAIILPDGPLSNAPFDYVRSWLLRHAHVEMIVSLPRNIFNGTSAKTNVVIAKKTAPSHQPCREPTALVLCETLADLETLGVVHHEAAVGVRQTVVLADCDDWRPEAHLGRHTEAEAGMVRLGDFFTIRTGAAKYGEKRELFDGPGKERLLLLRAKNLAPQGGLRLTENLAYIARDGSMFKPGAMVRPGELLFVRVGVGCYGRVAVVPNDFEAQADDWLHILTPAAVVDVAGFAAWMSSEAGRSRIRRLAKGVGALSVSKSSLAELSIPAHFVGGDLVRMGAVFGRPSTPRRTVSSLAAKVRLAFPTTPVRRPFPSRRLSPAV